MQLLRYSKVTLLVGILVIGDIKRAAECVNKFSSEDGEKSWNVSFAEWEGIS